MEKRALIALALSFAVFMVFLFMGEKWKKPAAPPAPPAKTAAQPETPPAAPPEARPAAPLPPAPRPPASRPAKEVVVETPLFRAVFTELGGRLQSFQLKKYRQALPTTPITRFQLGPVDFEVERYLDPQKNGGPPKELVRAGKSQELPLSLTWEGKNLTVPALLPYQASQPQLTLKPQESATLRFIGVSPEGLTITKILNFRGDSYSFDLAVKVANHSGKPLEGHLDLDLTANYAGEDSSRYNFLGFHASVNHRLEQIKAGSLKEFKTFTGRIDWASLDEDYFLTAMVPLTATKTLLTLKEISAGPMVATLRSPMEALAPGQEAQLSYALYFGPKDLDDLKPLNLGL